MGDAKKTRRKGKLRVLFVCTGNTCRSPMAEHIFRNFLRSRNLVGFEILSAGICASDGQPMSQNAKTALISMGIRPRKHSAASVTQSMLDKSRLIICMTQGHKAHLMQKADALDGMQRCFVLSEITGGEDVPDPYGQSLEKYLSTANYLLYACEDILRLALAVVNGDSAN